MIPRFNRNVFSDTWVNWVTGSFLVGATISLAFFTSDSVKDLKAGIPNKLELTGTPAIIFATFSCGVFFGSLGFAAAVLKNLSWSRRS